MRRFFCAFLLVCILLTFSCVASAEDPIRLHVVADSNDRAAQMLKLIVRDAVVAYTQTLTEDCQSEREAYAVIRENRKEITNIARDAARNVGYTGPVRAETGIFSFPAKLYGGLLVEAGEYRALRVSIGSAEGANWWCVLYPALCRYPDAETGGEVVIYSGIARLFMRLFGRS